MKKEIILASSNKNKIKEFSQILSDYKILSLSDIGFNDDIEETGKTFVENALIKAKTVSEFLKKQGIEKEVLADDSGLCVNALNGEPGIYSARYAGEHGNKEANIKKLQDKLKDFSDRSAYYVCVVVKYNPDGTYVYSEGKTEGEILKEKEGESGFAYDPIFFSKEINKSFGIATTDEKNSVSHRGKAIRKIKNMMS